jgi:hypothetical protein
MEYKKPVTVILAGAFALNALDARYGMKLFTDLPPMSAITAASTVSFTGTGFTPIYSRLTYSTVTDDLIEIPAIEKDRSGQS